MSEMSNTTPEKEKFHFYVPGFCENLGLYAMLSDFIEHIPQWFYDDFKISAAYGTFPGCIWNGGRAIYGGVSYPSMKKTVDELNKRGIAVRFTLTNPLIEEKHLSDTYANMCLKAADNGQNEILVNTQIIEDYVRKTYPSYKILSSTTKCLKTVEEVEAELEKDYYLVVLDSALNDDEKIFSIEKRDRLEMLVDHRCRRNCPIRVQHYNASGLAQLTFGEKEAPKCTYVLRSFEDLSHSENFITREMITNKYVPGGFKHFKLDGRTFSKEILVDSLLYYMVLPEYREKMKAIIKKEVYNNADVY